MADNDAQVMVWDLPTRLFHWLLVVGVVSGWVSYYYGDSALRWHLWNGYFVLLLLIFRWQWGVVGGSTARFGHFVRGPRAVVAALRDHPSVVGHNAAGGWSVVAMLTLITFQAVTGLFASDDYFVLSGPLKSWVGSEWSAAITTWHRQSYYWLLGLIGLHLAAILFYTVIKRQQLIMAMVKGSRRRTDFAGDCQPLVAASRLRLIIVLAVAIVSVTLIIW
jgi:cytochrome b